jgi:hypothetical protein
MASSHCEVVNPAVLSPLSQSLGVFLEPMNFNRESRPVDLLTSHISRRDVKTATPVCNGEQVNLLVDTTPSEDRGLVRVSGQTIINHHYSVSYYFL